MSLHLSMNDARLTVFGYGWDDEIYDSGEGDSPEGEAWEQIADDLGYDTGEDIDWDDYADTYDPDPGDDSFLDDAIYVDEGGTIYADEDGDGIWTDEYGNEYGGDGDMYLPEDVYQDIADQLEESCEEDATLSPYSIPQETLNSLPIGGPISQGGIPNGSDLPHLYSPPANYYLLPSNSIIYTSGKLSHKPFNGSDYTVVEAKFAVHGSSYKTAYFDNCHPLFEEVGGGDIASYLPPAYSGLNSSNSDVRHKYLVWQLCYGSFGSNLITDPTGTAGDTSQIDTIEYHGTTYYKVG